MKLYLARFSINKGWGTRFDNEYKEVESKLFKNRESAEDWLDVMERKTSYHSMGGIKEHTVY